MPEELPLNDPIGRRIPSVYRKIGKQRAASVRCLREALGHEDSVDWAHIARAAEAQHYIDNNNRESK